MEAKSAGNWDGVNGACRRAPSIAASLERSGLSMRMCISLPHGGVKMPNTSLSRVRAAGPLRRGHARTAAGGSARVQRRIPAVPRQPSADDAGRARSAWRVARAAGGMVRDLPRRQPLVPQPPPVAPIGRADWRSTSRRPQPRARLSRLLHRRGPSSRHRPGGRRLPADADARHRRRAHCTPSCASAYGVMRNDPAEVGAALGYWSAVYLELCRATGAEPVTSDPVEVLIAHEAGRGVPARRAGTRPALDTSCARWRRSPSFVAWSTGCGSDRTRWSACAAASLALYAGTMDFCALHALTGSHWLRIVWPALPDPDLALRYFWQAIAALYPKIGFPDLPSPEQLRGMAARAHARLAGDQGSGRQMRRRARHQPHLLRLRRVEVLWRPALPVWSPRAASG